MNFVVFSDDWGAHPSSCQHLFQRICGEHKTLWINTVGMRPPRLSLEDLRKAFRKVSTMLETRKPKSASAMPAAGPIVRAPFMLPFDRPRWIEGLNQSSIARTVLRAVQQHGMRPFHVVTTVPNVHRALGSLGAEKVIYYCVDDFSEWPGLDRSIILDMENRLLSSVDRIVCTSEALFARFHERFSTAMLTHGVDVEMFSNPLDSVHPRIASIPEPRVGYFGLLDQRTDHELLCAVAKALPGVSVVITGPTEGDCKALRSLPNVHFTGPVSYSELPSVVLGWSVCLLPYRLNDLTRNINPLKLKEYLATGKPVLSTPLPESLKLLPHLRIASTADDWASSIQEALSGAWTQDKAKVVRFLEPHSWGKKAQEFLRLCEAA